MAFKYSADATIGVSLNPIIAKPLDIRSVVSSISELYSIPKEYAYQGMTVANIADGNIYMLIDKNQIGYKEGWKASYESIQIRDCSYQEYEEWKNNTTDTFQPIDETKPWIQQNTYYYIYEDSLEDSQFYLSAEWGKQIEEQLSKKATSDSVVNALSKIATLETNLEKNYASIELLEESYTPLSYFDLEDSESFISTTLANYYTKTETDDIFVTKESLRGEGMEGDDFVFVTKAKYDEDYIQLNETLSQKIETNSEAILSKLQVPEIGFGDSTIVFTETGASLNGEEIAKTSQIPVIQVVTKEEFEQMSENTNEDYTPINPDIPSLVEGVYYYVVNETNSLVTKDYLESSYSTTNQIQLWVSQNFYKKTEIDTLISTLEERITTLEAQIV